MNDNAQDADQAELDDFINEAVGASEPQADDTHEQAELELKPEVEIPESVEVPGNEVNEGQEPEKDGIQKRFDKLTAARYEAERKAQELEQRLAQYEQQSAPKEPKLEDFDYDDEAYANAKAEYIASQKIAEQQQEQLAQAKLQEQATIQAGFNAKVAETLKEKPDWSEKAALVPQLHPTVLDAIKRDPNATDVIYHLGNNLEKAYEVAGSDPIQAVMEIGRLSAMISQPKPVKTPSAPKPIEALQSGAVIESDIGDPDTPIDEWMAKFNP